MTDTEKVLHDKLTHLEVVVESLLDVLINSGVVDYKVLQKAVDKHTDTILDIIEENSGSIEEPTPIDENELDDNTIPFYFWGPGGDA